MSSPLHRLPRTVLLPFWPSQNRKLKLRKGKNVLNPTQQWEGGLDSDPGLTSETMLFYTSIISIWKFTWIFYVVMKNSKNHICWKLHETRSSCWVRKSDAEKQRHFSLRVLELFIESSMTEKGQNEHGQWIRHTWKELSVWDPTLHKDCMPTSAFGSSQEWF